VGALRRPARGARARGVELSRKISLFAEDLQLISCENSAGPVRAATLSGQHG
jgi:hypothetical protein